MEADHLTASEHLAATPVLLTLALIVAVCLFIILAGLGYFTFNDDAGS